MNYHSLTGQNLKRHQALQDYWGSGNTIISDSISLKELAFNYWKLSKINKTIHALELYNISAIAMISEMKYQIRRSRRDSFDLIKIPIIYFLIIVKIILLRSLMRNSNIIVSSEMRRDYLRNKDGFENKIFVIKNKPIYAEWQAEGGEMRKNQIVLTGNLNNRNDFVKIAEVAAGMGIGIICYGISKQDKKWLFEQKFRNVKIEEKIDSEEIMVVLRQSKYAVCLYSESSENQKLSASSKIFEVVYWGCIPLVSANEGLIFELNLLGCNYLTVNEISEIKLDKIKFNQNFDRNSCLFKSEISKLSMGDA
jgi:hypothetical protein